ncbi:ABC transporter ATP-binding protein [Deinococcus budaensis]|uniref:ABC-type Fe3+/spermidine/putrescine transport system ATPase subunit n=1 Tax=Deinococcus budaensis TaxID=1665626 RepID=A0A7W8LQR0_9DEIO|nr:ABC transporter ATP-binding protein [Deinococcus budaensis]MBB5235009.1 ABC-type Fe3+/spermidine/putrescine transport system ATPase subunit [Deinococcus budaensis]
MIPPALALHHFSKRFGPTVAAEDVTLTVAPGETVALLGPSGCGKSTVLRGVAGLERVGAGRVEVAGRDVTALAPEERQVGLVFQDYALFPHLNVLGNVAYGPRMRGAGRAEAERRAREALALVGLEALGARRPAELSGGQAQRVALARAVATGSPLLLLDEPLSNLDEQLRARLRADLRGLFARVGAGVLLVTHDQREALALASRVAVMRAGRLVQVGAAAEVFARPATAWVAAFLGHANVLPGPGGTAHLIPEDAVRLGEGDPHPVTARQTTDTGTEVAVAHPLGPLTLHLSARETGQLQGGTLRLTLDPARVLTLPDDRVGT